MNSIYKAGCILVNIETKKIALVCRENEYSFPKGHLEDGETLKECAIRETKEETGHNCHLVESSEIIILNYNTSKGIDVKCYFYLAVDDGPAKEGIPEKNQEITVWKNFEKIEDMLSYQNLKDMWNDIKNNVKKVLYEYN